MAALVSILIPAYNSERWIAETLRSAAAQTWPNKEIIIVDDGSSDRTLEIAAAFSSSNTRLVAQDNAGAAAARNTAFSLCQGDYIQWLDADDILDPDKIRAQMLALRDVGNPRTLISGSWASFLYRTSVAQFEPTPLWRDLSPRDWLLLKMGLNLHMQTDNWLVSRELSEAAGPWDVKLMRDNDGEYFCRVLLASDGVLFIPEARSYYRFAGYRSVSYIGGSTKKLESLLRSIKLHIHYLRSMEDSDITRAACVQYIRTWLHEFYPFRVDLAEELKQLIAELGGIPNEPRLSWKYDWLVKLFGWEAGRRAQIELPKFRARTRLAWDRLMFAAEQRDSTRRGQK